MMIDNSSSSGKSDLSPFEFMSKIERHRLREPKFNRDFRDEPENAHIHLDLEERHAEEQKRQAFFNLSAQKQKEIRAAEMSHKLGEFI